MQKAAQARDIIDLKVRLMGPLEERLLRTNGEAKLVLTVRLDRTDRFDDFKGFTLGEVPRQLATEQCV